MIGKDIKVDYNSVESEGSEELSDMSVQSGVMDTYFWKATAGCQVYGNPNDCQTLANLCVLNLYQADKTVCNIVKEINEKNVASPTYPSNYYDPSYTEGVPWLYYKENGEEVIEKSNRIKFRASFSYEDKALGIVSTLDLWVAKYNLEGVFYGFEKLSKQLVICDKPNDEVERLYRIGTTVDISCTIDLGKLVSTSSWDHFRNENMFFDLFLKDYDGVITDIPVLITNLDNNSNEDRTKWQMGRRFFLFDTVSGQLTNQYPNGVPDVVRYSQQITLKIELDPT